MPYLPPADPNYDELDCILVFYPNKPEYRQALLGSIADLSNVWNWEADRPTQAIIRQAWLDAEECTLECVEMSCLDAIANAIQNLADVLAADDGCCDEVTTVPPGADEVSGTDDSTGAPEYDREADEHPTEFPDPAAYDAYLCGAAHNFADSTDGAVDAVYDTILVASNIIVFATLIVLAFGNVIGMAIAAVLAGGYTLVTISEVFGFFSAFTELRELLGGGDPGGLVPQTKSELDAIHDDLVDAIFCSNDASEATAQIHALVDANVTSTSYRAILKLVWNELVIRAVFAGFVNVADRFDCTCDDTGDLEFLMFVPEENTTVTQIDAFTYRMQNSGVNARVTVWLQIEDCGVPTLAPGSLDWTAEIDGTVFGPSNANHRLVSAWSNPNRACGYSAQEEVDVNPFLDPITGTGDVPFVDSHTRTATITGNRHVALSIECRVGSAATGLDVIARFKNFQRNLT